MSQTFETLHGLVDKGVKVDLGIPYELWDKPSAEVTHLKTQCEHLLEKYEEGKRVDRLDNGSNLFCCRHLRTTVFRHRKLVLGYARRAAVQVLVRGSRAQERRCGMPGRAVGEGQASRGRHEEAGGQVRTRRQRTLAVEPKACRPIETN